MTGLEALALAAVLSVADAEDATERARLQGIAFDVALAVELGRVPFTGPAAREAAALALVAIGFGESGFRPNIGDCRVTGDHGRSVSFYQVMRGPNWAGCSREGICGNGSLAALLGLRAFAIHAQPSRSHLGTFYGYASGSASRPSDAGRRHCFRWQTLAHSAGLVASCFDKAPITFAATPKD